MSKIMINVRALQAVRNGLLRFDTETKNFEVLNENGDWIVTNAGITQVDYSETVEQAENVVTATNVTSAATITSAGTVEHAENTHTHNDTILNVSGTDTFVVLTYTEYNELSNKNANTIYVITG